MSESMFGWTDDPGKTTMECIEGALEGIKALRKSGIHTQEQHAIFQTHLRRLADEAEFLYDQFGEKSFDWFQKAQQRG